MNLEELIPAWQNADEFRRAAALAALRGEKPALVSAPALGRTFSLVGVARIAGVSRQTVHAALQAGALRAVPLYAGGRRRVREADLAVWLSGRIAT